jgi:hypothetical protein
MEQTVRQQSLQTSVGERITHNEFRQNAKACSRNQGRHHGVPVIHAKQTRRPHRRGFPVIVCEAPSVRRHCICIADARMLCEVQRVLRPPTLAQVCG